MYTTIQMALSTLPFILYVNIATKVGFIVVAHLDLNNFPISSELRYNVIVEILEILIQLSIIIFQGHIYKHNRHHS